MGYGPVINGKQTPITPWKGSWAYDMEQRRLNPPKTQDSQWPLGKRYPRINQKENPVKLG